MRLAIKAPLLVAGLIAIFTCVDYFLHQKTTIAEFEQLERKHAAVNLDRVVREVSNDGERLSAMLSEWTTWDDNYQYIQSPNQAFLDSINPQDNARRIGIDAILWLDPQFELVHSEYNNLLISASTELRALNQHIVTKVAPKIKQQDDKPLSQQQLYDFVLFDQEIFLVAARPIIKSNETGPIAGYLLFTQHIDNQYVSKIADRLLLNTTIKPAQALTQVQASELNHYHYGVTPEGMLTVSSTVQGLSSDDLAQVTVAINREVISGARESVMLTIELTLLSSAISILVIVLMLHFDIISPISKATKNINHIIETKDYSALVTSSRNDEIGLMEQQFNVLLNQVKRQNTELEQLATTDNLTALANRHALSKFLDNEWQRGIREQTPLSIIICDIDFFKQFNDNYGHQAGDECLVKFAQVLKGTNHRKTDLAARYGGEEFVLVLPNTPIEGAVTRAKKFKQALATAAIPHLYSLVSESVTASIGVATLIPCPNKTPEVLIKMADENLYFAKESGRNRIESGLSAS